VSSPARPKFSSGDYVIVKIDGEPIKGYLVGQIDPEELISRRPFVYGEPPLSPAYFVVVGDYPDDHMRAVSEKDIELDPVKP
jgi:hypothetical protein